MTDLEKMFGPPQESLLDVFMRLQMIKDCMNLPRLENGLYRNGKRVEEGKEWIVCEPEVTDIFETSSVGFAPAPLELKSFRKWNEEQRNKKCQIG
jgi:hypothetical protein